MKKQTGAFTEKYDGIAKYEFFRSAFISEGIERG